MAFLGRVLALAVSSCALVAAPAEAGVVVLGTNGSQQSFTSLPAALAAAQNGDLVLLGSGTYAGFTLNARSLRVVAAPGSTAHVQGPVTIQNVPARGAVVLDGLTIDTTALVQDNAPALVRITGCAGDVRLFHCNVTGATGGYDELDDGCDGITGSAAVAVTSSPRVVFAHCTLRGGQGSQGYLDFLCETGLGGTGLSITNSSVVVHDSLVVGGNGGQNPGQYEADSPGAGGAGCVVAGGRLFASSGTIQGGHGASFGLNSTGRGGNGLVVQSGKVVLRSTALVAGLGGHGPNGVPSVGSFDLLARPARSADLAALTGDQATLSLSVTGFAGDQFFLIANERAGFHFADTLNGAWLLAHPALFPVNPTPLITLPATGTFQVNVLIGDLANATFANSFLQVLALDTIGASIESTPLHLAVLDAQAAGDCDGNGVFDLVDVIGGASDCDGDLQLDVCQSDCNANGNPDACDISTGVSPDVNGNTIPDECESGVVWVDASAAPGGNGSQAAPFQSIAQGISAAQFFGTVRVRDGVYTGPQNRNLDFGGRRLTLESENGSANCVLDAQGNTGPIVRLHSHELPGTRISGLTLRGAVLHDSDLGGLGGAALHVDGANVTVRDCLLIANHSESLGGAVFVRNVSSFPVGATNVDDVRFVDCTFSQNTITLSDSDDRRSGGALCFIGKVLVRGCTFKQNQAVYGGAIEQRDVPATSCIGHSSFFRNIASLDGGAIHALDSGSASDSRPLRITDCRIEGNFANRSGGGVSFAARSGNFYAGQFVLKHCTIAANIASVAGGGLSFDGKEFMSTYNSIFYGNSAPSGNSMAQVASGTIQINVYESDVEGGLSGVPHTVFTQWIGNIDADPLFVDADGPDNNPLTFADNDLHLLAASPCVDTGDDHWDFGDWDDIDDDGVTNELPPFDLDLRPRLAGAETDMGAYEL